MRTTTLEVILPFDNQGDAYATDSVMRHEGGNLEHDLKAWRSRPYPQKQAPYKTLFLLHGISGNHADWISETRIRHWAESRGIAVVMPSGYNAFYLDQPEVHNYYGRYVGQELVEVARRMFPLSERRGGHVPGRHLHGRVRRAEKRPQVLRDLRVDRGALLGHGD